MTEKIAKLAKPAKKRVSARQLSSPAEYWTAYAG